MNITRIVKVYSTKGRKLQQVESQARTWGELKIELATAGIETSGMRAIIGENKITLESSLAVLPLSLKVDMEVTSDFTLFLSPVKMESGIKNNIGALCYKELKTTIKNITRDNPEAAKHFGNYPHMGSDQLRNVLTEWYKQSDGNCAITPLTQPVSSPVIEIGSDLDVEYCTKENVLDEMDSTIED